MGDVSVCFFFLATLKLVQKEYVVQVHVTLKERDELMQYTMYITNVCYLQKNNAPAQP